MQQEQVRSIVYALQQNIRRVIVGKDEAIELALIALLCRGHVLIEDVPGVGKTTLVAALARSLSCTFKRIQFTPDVMPSDITGFTMPSLTTGQMEFKPGAVMSQIVLADEINRTSPRTQSSLLEVMEEGQVTVDGVTHPLPRPFMVLATQNPVDFVGTYPLPEAQMDRFFLRITIGYPTMEEEMDVLERYSGQVSPLPPCKAFAAPRTCWPCRSRWARCTAARRCAPMWPPSPPSPATIPNWPWAYRPGAASPCCGRPRPAPC